MALVFIVDTSPSMQINDCPIVSREGSPCISRLDCAKACVETFVRRHRQSPPQFLLVTTSSGGNARVNVGWGASLETFERELKYLQVSKRDSNPPHLSLNSALSISFQLLSHQRLKKNVDNFGLGRQPWSIIPSCVILISDGNSHTGAGAKVQLPGAPRRDDFVCNAPFRWDQRLYTINISSMALPNPLVVMTDATGGRCWQSNVLPELITNMSHVHDELVNGGVVVRFKSEDSHDSGALSYLGVRPSAMKSTTNPCRQAGASAAHWPIPEEFWCDRKSAKLPPRFAHPTLLYLPIIEGGVNNKPSLNGAPPPGVLETDFRLGEKFDLYCSFGLPIDWYQLGWMRDSDRLTPPFKTPSPEQQQHWKQRYAVYANNSGRMQGRGSPIGILLKIETVWCLAILPYNFGDLSVLLQKAITGGGVGLDNALSSYVKNLPSSHHIPLARVLTIATHPSRNNGSNKGSATGAGGGGIKPLRNNKACAILLRLLAHASSTGGDAGLSEPFKEWKKRQIQHADNEDQRNRSAMNRIVNSLPKRTALLWHTQQSQLWRGSNESSSAHSSRNAIQKTTDGIVIEQPEVFSKPPAAKLIGLETFDELCALPISELMPRWTQISRRLYGGNGCDLLSQYTGMYSSNDEPCSVVMAASTSSSPSSSSSPPPLSSYNTQKWTGLDIGGIGFRRYASVPAQEMSSFYPVLAKVQLLRKPSDEKVMDMKLDKKQELEIVWREKMSGNFSNPYASPKSKRSSNSKGLTDDGESFLTDDIALSDVKNKNKLNMSGDGKGIVVGNEEEGGNEVFPFKVDEGNSSSSSLNGKKKETENLFNDSINEMSLLVADTPIHTSSFDIPTSEKEAATSFHISNNSGFSSKNSQVVDVVPSSKSSTLSPASSGSLRLPRADLHRTKRRKRTESISLIQSDASTTTAATPSESDGTPSSPLVHSPVSVAGQGGTHLLGKPIKRKEGDMSNSETSSTNEQSKSPRIEQSHAVSNATTATAAATSVTTSANSVRSLSPSNTTPEDYSHLILPEGWIVAYSKRNQKYYFFNTINNTSLWEPPAGTTQKPI